MHQSAAFYVGKAIHTLFPKEVYKGSLVGSRGFICTFSYSETFDFALLEHLERTIEIAPFDTMEMLATNAAELFEYLKFEQLARHSRERGGTVHVARSEDFADFFIDEIEPCEAVALLGFELGKKEVRIFGKGFKSKQERRQFLKTHKLFKRTPQPGKEIKRNLVHHLEKSLIESIEKLGIATREIDGNLFVEDEWGILHDGPRIQSLENLDPLVNILSATKT